jgi:tetratricopeptide (TPR) repeat protein
MIILGSLMMSVNADEVNKINRKANKLYGQGKYGEALKLYDDALLLDPSDGKLKMNRGSALYRLDEFEEAEQSYLGALSNLPQDDKKALADAYYNLGNALYKQGELLESAGNAASARGKYAGALENYINTLKTRPGDKDAKWNLQMAHQKVNFLENQEDQSEDQNQDKDDKGDKQEDKRGDDKEDKGDNGDKDNQNNEDNEDNEDQNDESKRQEQRPQERENRDMKKEEAERLIEQYADDSDSLNKPTFRRVKIRQPEKDW